MELKLTRPICFFDLETTGIEVAKDRIVEIAIFKVYPNGNKESKTWLVNPTIPIPAQSTAVHGITNEKVANEPKFDVLAPLVYNMIKDSDLAGFNSNRFDIPLLAEELLRNGFDFDLSKHRPIDAQVIYHKMEPRNLGAAYKYYCGKDLIDAHSAEADTLATYEVLMAQIEKYDELENDNKFLSEFSSQRKTIDLAGFIQQDEKGNAIISFGKYKGQVVSDVFAKDPGYYTWLQNADFPLYTKKVFTKIKLSNGF